MSDFSNIVDSGVVFIATELDSGVDFTPSGDQGQIIVTGVGGFGEGGFGEGGFGGDVTTLIIGASATVWTNIDEP